jgi:hypothetical protein
VDAAHVDGPRKNKAISMSAAELTKSLWDFANSITAFAVIQGLVFVYSCLKKETGDVLNKRRLKAAIAIVIFPMIIAQCTVVDWCRRNQCLLDVSHCRIYTEASTVRIASLIGIGVSSMLALYARQLFSRKPFDE